MSQFGVQGPPKTFQGSKNPLRMHVLWIPGSRSPNLKNVILKFCFIGE